MRGGTCITGMQLKQIGYKMPLRSSRFSQTAFVQEAPLPRLTCNLLPLAAETPLCFQGLSAHPTPCPTKPPPPEKETHQEDKHLLRFRVRYGHSSGSSAHRFTKSQPFSAHFNPTSSLEASLFSRSEHINLLEKENSSSVAGTE